MLNKKYSNQLQTNIDFRFYLLAINSICLRVYKIRIIKIAFVPGTFCRSVWYIFCFISSIEWTIMIKQNKISLECNILIFFSFKILVTDFHPYVHNMYINVQCFQWDILVMLFKKIFYELFLILEPFIGNFTCIYVHIQYTYFLVI